MPMRDDLAQFTEQLIDEAAKEIARDFLKIDKPEEAIELKREHRALERVAKALRLAVEQAKKQLTKEGKENEPTE